MNIKHLLRLDTYFEGRLEFAAIGAAVCSASTIWFCVVYDFIQAKKEGFKFGLRWRHVTVLSYSTFKIFCA